MYRLSTIKSHSFRILVKGKQFYITKIYETAIYIFFQPQMNTDDGINYQVFSIIRVYLRLSSKAGGFIHLKPYGIINFSLGEL